MIKIEVTSNISRIKAYTLEAKAWMLKTCGADELVIDNADLEFSIEQISKTEFELRVEVVG